MNWKIPLSDIVLTQQEIEAVSRVLRSGWLSMGSVVQAFEQSFAHELGVRHALAVSNGTAGLHLALLGIGIGPGDEVIVPSLTFVATANAVTYCGARPVFADIISRQELTNDPSDIERKITPRTKAILIMHYGGHSCQMSDIRAIADRHGLAIIEDAAHAVGAYHDGTACGGLGDAAAFSFFANKNLVTGEGGMVTTNRDDVASRVRLMRSHGMTTMTWERHKGHAYSYDVISSGYNYRLDEMRAALGLQQLERLKQNNERRSELVAYYRELLSDIPWLEMPFENRTGSSNHLMTVVLREGVDRGKVMESLRAEGIQTSVHYPPVHLFTYYRQKLGTYPGMLPITEEVGASVLTLPLFPTMTRKQIEEVVDSLSRMERQF